MSCKYLSILKKAILAVLLIISTVVYGICLNELAKYDLPLTYKMVCVSCNTRIAEGRYCTGCGKSDIAFYHNKYCTTCDSVSLANGTYCESCGKILGTKITIDNLDEDINYINRIRITGIVAVVIVSLLFPYFSILLINIPLEIMAKTVAKKVNEIDNNYEDLIK